MTILESFYYTVECKEVNNFEFKPKFSKIEEAFGYEIKSKFCIVCSNNLETILKCIKKIDSETVGCSNA